MNKRLIQKAFGRDLGRFVLELSDSGMNVFFEQCWEDELPTCAYFTTNSGTQIEVYSPKHICFKYEGLMKNFHSSTQAELMKLIQEELALTETSMIEEKVTRRLNLSEEEQRDLDLLELVGNIYEHQCEPQADGVLVVNTDGDFKVLFPTLKHALASFLFYLEESESFDWTEEIRYIRSFLNGMDIYEYLG